MLGIFLRDENISLHFYFDLKFTSRGAKRLGKGGLKRRVLCPFFGFNRLRLYVFL